MAKLSWLHDAKKLYVQRVDIPADHGPQSNDSLDARSTKGVSRDYFVGYCIRCGSPWASPTLHAFQGPNTSDGCGWTQGKEDPC